MTAADRDLVLKKVARIETCVHELRTLGEPDLIRSDLRQERFIEHTLQIAVQSVLDVASHIVSEERLGEPRSNHELIDLLTRGGWISPELGPVLHGMIGFRNILVHGYDEVSLAVVEDVTRHRLDDLLAFARSIRDRMAARS